MGNSDHYQTLFKLCYHESMDVRKEAIWSFCNSTKVSTDEKIIKMIENGILKLFADCLAIKEDSEIVLIVFEGIKSIFGRKDSEVIKNPPS